MATMKELDSAIRGFELELTRRYYSYENTGFTDAAERRELSLKEQELSFGQNVLEWISDGGTTEKYFPSLYCRFGAQRTPIPAAEVNTGLCHPAFYVGSSLIKNLYIGKYQGLIKSSNGKNLLLSLRGVDPTVSQTRATFITAGHNNGATHHMCTNAEYAFLTLLCKSQGYQPRGNNSYGKDYAKTDEHGEIANTYDSSGTKYLGRTLTGSGPCSWNHTGDPFGVADLNGNIYEFADGLELLDGVIKIVQNNDAASGDSTINALYKNILSDGTLAAVGDANALGFAAAGAPNKITAATGLFQNIPQVYGSASENNCPAILKELCIIPHDAGDYGSDYFYLNTSGSFLCLRGGRWGGTSYAGVFDLDLGNGLSDSNHVVGARPAFYRV